MILGGSQPSGSLLEVFTVWWGFLFRLLKLIKQGI